MSNPDPAARPWQREPFVWMVIAFPAAAVLAGIVTIYLAVVSDDGLVVDDYYKHGLEINRLLDREQHAADAGLAMKVDFASDTGTMLVTLTANPGFVYPAEINGLLAHATREGLDQALRLMRVGDTVYRAADITLPPGQWYVDIGTESWRLTKRITSR